MNIGIKDILYRARFFFIPYLILLCGCLIVKLTYSRDEIYYAVNSHYSTWADMLAPYVTNIGDGITVILASALLLFFSYRKAFLMLTTYLVTAVVAQAIKHIFDAPRPRLYFKDQLPRIHFIKGVDQLSLHSFPSGHTVTIFAATLLLTYWCKNKLLGLPLLLLAILVGYSRMYLSQHFFEDVIAGSVIAVIVTVFWIRWCERQQFLSTAKWNRGLLKKS
jgi:membrane-associated phospholipid phosphatase